MARKSFIDRVQPSKARSKIIDWPFLVEGEDVAPKVLMKVLGQDQLEAANIEAADYFRAVKATRVTEKNEVFVSRERICLVWRAYEDEDGEPLAATSEELGKMTDSVITSLYNEWSRFQSDVATRPLTQKHMDELVEGLKKNTLGDLLHALPTIWLIALCTTLASQLPDSIPANERG